MFVMQSRSHCIAFAFVRGWWGGSGGRDSERIRRGLNGITIPLAQRYSLRSVTFVIRVLKVGRKKKDLWDRGMVYWQTTGPSLKATLGQEDEHDDDDDGKFYRIQVHLECVLYGPGCVLRSMVKVEDLPPRAFSSGSMEMDE